MISVIIPTLNDERRLVAVLAPLVPAAMEGLVRELICADGGSTDATFEIADDAGANFLKLHGDAETRIAEAAKKAKGPWLLLLDPVVRLEAGWESAALKHMNARTSPGRFRLQAGEGGWLSRLAPPRARATLLLKAGGKGAAKLLDARAWVSKG